MLSIRKLAPLFIGAMLPFLSVAKSVPDFPLTSLSQSPNSQFEDYKGQWLYVDFWASWCGPCKRSFPYMNELQAKYKAANFKIMAISLDAEKSDALSFLAKQSTSFDVFHDPEGKFASYFELPGMPTSYLVDPTGKVVATHVGFNTKTKDKVNKQLQAVLVNK